MNPNQYNGLTLAYIGDAVFELIIRKHCVELGFGKVNDLHKKVIKYTNGKSQSEFIHYFLENNILTDDELLIFKRGRNSHVNTCRKNLDLKDYLDATGFEALFGYLYLNNSYERINQLVDIILKEAKLNDKG